MSEPEPSMSERTAKAYGKNPGEVAALDRFFAAAIDLGVARLRLDIAVMECAGSLRNFADAWQRSEDRLTAQEAREIAVHPDLAEVNVHLDGFYAETHESPPQTEV